MSEPGPLYHTIAIPNESFHPAQYPMRHYQIDRLHHAMEAILGVKGWGDARDCVAAILRANGDKLHFHIALESALVIYGESGHPYPTPILLLGLAAAYVWVQHAGDRG